MKFFSTSERQFRVAVLASLQRIERALGVEHSALKNLIEMENKKMTTLADILAKATALADTAGAAQVNEQHLIDAANAHVADLQTQLDAANAAVAAGTAGAPDPAQLDAIGAALDQAKAVADAMASAT
ncbi:MAG: hypothetical protein ABJA10_07500 [Aestuariivirga sp.]